MPIAQATDMEVVSGGLLNLVEPRAEDISLADIASALSRLCRFTGHVNAPFYSVAQHSCVVADLVAPEHRVHALLHDAHEAYIGDISSPMKAALRALDPNFPRALWMLEQRIINAIYESAGVARPSPGVGAIIKQADMIALAIEQRDIMRSKNDWGLPYPLPESYRINRYLTPWAAQDAFEDALNGVGLSVFDVDSSDLEDAA